MKHRIISAALALCLWISSQSAAYAFQEEPVLQEPAMQEEVLAEETPEEMPDVPAREVLPEDTPDDGNDSDNLDGQDDLGSGEDEPAIPQEPPIQEEVLPEEIPEETPDVPIEEDDPEEMTDATAEKVLPKATTDTMAEKVFPKELPAELVRSDGTIPSPAEAYAAMIALKDLDMYREGTPWTDDEPYSDEKGYYRWKGGSLDGKNIVAVGCVAFAFTLSDAAFGSLPGRMYAAGAFSYEDIKVGDILRVNNDTHTVIVLEVSDVGVVVAEGNISTGDHKGRVHWGRGISKEEVMRDTSHYITRYPEGYVPDDPGADDLIAEGSLAGGLAWKLTKAGTLTVSGQGAMPDYSSVAEQPWSEHGSQIRKVVIEEGVTRIGNSAFWDCGVIGVEIPSSVTAIGNNAFYNSSIISVTVPSNVKSIGDSAFCKCQNLSSVTVCEGVETIGQNAFRACTSLDAIALPSSIQEVGAAAFFQCTALKNATFAPGSVQVKMGDNIFTECHWLMGVTLPAKIDCISEGMFQNCHMLAGVEIPQGTESIKGSAFASCSGFTTVVIPDSVTTIGIAAFANCPLQDIYFTGSETQWNGIRKIGDTAAAVAKATIHYHYTPDPDDGDDNDNNTGGDNDNTGDDNDNNTGDDNDNAGDDNDNTGGNNTGNNSGNTSNGNKPGSGPNDNSGNHAGTYSDKGKGDTGVSSNIISGAGTVVEAWKPKTPDERKRYACLGKETVRYTPSKENAYPITVENAMQGPMCFASFEAVLGGYTIGRTYNIYSSSDHIYSMDKEIEFTIRIPSDIYKKNREYKMICVTKGGQPIVYNDLDNDPETITIRTNKFYAYALVYKQR